MGIYYLNSWLHRKCCDPYNIHSKHFIKVSGTLTSILSIHLSKQTWGWHLDMKVKFSLTTFHLTFHGKAWPKWKLSFIIMCQQLFENPNQTLSLQVRVHVQASESFCLYSPGAKTLGMVTLFQWNAPWGLVKGGQPLDHCSREVWSPVLGLCNIKLPLPHM